jgi:hypothetical protein
MIASFIPGRVRIRNPQFKDPDLAATAVTLLREHPCVLKATVNSTTGGLLIEYEPEKMDMEAARQALEMIDPEAMDWFQTMNQAGPNQPDEALATGEVRRLAPALAANREALEYLGMLAAFVVCTGSAFLRSKGLHIYSGISLAGMTLNHIYKYRQSLLGRFKRLAVPRMESVSDERAGDCK